MISIVEVISYIGCINATPSSSCAYADVVANLKKTKPSDKTSQKYSLYCFDYMPSYLRRNLALLLPLDAKANAGGLRIACNENVKEAFQGRIIEIERFEYDQFMNGRFFNLRIESYNNPTKVITYQYTLKPNKELLEFVEIGQTATKVKGKKTFLIEDSMGQKQEFLIATCDQIEK